MKQNNIINDKNMYMYTYDELPPHINYEKMDEVLKMNIKNNLLK